MLPIAVTLQTPQKVLVRDRCVQCSMVLEPGKAYRAKTAAGIEITFTVIDVWRWGLEQCRTGQRRRRGAERLVEHGPAALDQFGAQTKTRHLKAADEIIDVLENSVDQSYVPEAGRRGQVVAGSQPQFGRRIFPEQRAVADIAADHGERAVAGLAHDGELACPIQIRLGGEAGAQGMAGIVVVTAPVQLTTGKREFTESPVIGSCLY